jgi:hypothetical protein
MTIQPTHRAAFAGLAAFAAASPAFAQTAADILRQVAGARSTTGALTNADAEGGLREALTNGAVNAVLRVGKLDGYWRDGAIQIPLPGLLGDAQRLLKPLGQSRLLDDLQLRMNRAAETAAPRARDLFVSAIRGMSVQDAVGIVRGGETAGTEYLRGRTQDQLKTAFRPIVTNALDGAGALRAFDRAVQRHGAQGLVGASPRDALTDFATSKALDGLFYYVGQEERDIRTNPVKRTTELLRRVFGG